MSGGGEGGRWLIVARPALFGRAYEAGERVPASEVDPKAEKRLLKLGIIKPAPEAGAGPGAPAGPQGAPPEGQGKPLGGAEGGAGAQASAAGAGSAARGAQGGEGAGGGHICASCGKRCANKAALVAHRKAHGWLPEGL